MNESTFSKKLAEYKKNRKEIIEKYKSQANDPEVIAYYKTVAEEEATEDIEII